MAWLPSCKKVEEYFAGFSPNPACRDDVLLQSGTSFPAVSWASSLKGFCFTAMSSNTASNTNSAAATYANKRSTTNCPCLPAKTVEPIALAQELTLKCSSMVSRMPR